MNFKQTKIIHNEEIKAALEESISNCKEELLIVSAFVKIDVIKWIDQHVKKNIKKELLVRFRKTDIMSNATDFNLIDYCAENQWTMKFDQSLHSKVYLFDRDSFIIGSANATNKGLSFVRESNKETMVLGSLDETEFFKIKKMVESANHFTKETVKKMREEICELVPNNEARHEWGSYIFATTFSFNQDIFLLKEDLLTSEGLKSLNHADERMLDLKSLIVDKNDREFIKEKFLKSKIYVWLINKLANEPDGTIYFGKLSQLMHSDLILNDPIFRVDVKVALSNLLNWIIDLEINEVSIDRPNYSQRIKLNA